MNNKRATKRALLTSVMALVMCVVMLVGTTFAWFTDTASTGVNKIQAGNLDVELWYKNTKDDDFNKVIDNSTEVFKDGTLWEPGHVEYVVLKIRNAGNLALKYKLGINIAGETGSTNVYGDPFKLSDSIKFAVIDGDKSTLGRDDLVAAATDSKLIKDGYTSVDTPLYPAGTEGKDAEKTVTLVVWMPTGVGNEANHKTGVDAPTIDLGIKVDATQYTYEKDSIDDQYDKDAGYLVQVNSENIQDYLDGKYGSIDGMTLVLAEGEYDELVLGKPSPYAASGTRFTCPHNDPTDNSGPVTFDSVEGYISHMNAKPHHGDNTRSFSRTIRNLTITAQEGVTVKGLKLISRTYGDNADPFVNGRSGYNVIVNAYNLKFSNIVFTGKVEISSQFSNDVIIDGVTFTGCTFETNNAVSSDGQALNYSNSLNNGKVRNLVVDDCKFANSYQGVYTNNVRGVSVTDSTFDTTGHNAIAIQDPGNVPVNHGAVVIAGNIFTSIGDRVIRFNNVGADTQITIKGNKLISSSKAEVIKAEQLADGIKYDISGNNWGDGKTVANTEFVDK